MNLSQTAKDVADGKYKNIIIMCGAGISTAAGVPDFRSPSIGLYNKLRNIKDLPYPEAVFDINFFRYNPLPFYTLVRQIFPERLCPTATHKFYGLLHKKGVLRRIYTQNIDALEVLAGVPESKVIEAHGTFRTGHCTNPSCRQPCDLPWLKSQIFQPEKNEGVPKCAKCKGVMRPDVVFFGEKLPARFWDSYGADFEACDLLIVMGTSLAVAPFNGLVAKPKRGTPRMFINKTKPGSVGFVGWVMGFGRSSAKFDSPTDLVVLQDCDATVREFCDQVGWRDELESMPVQILEAGAVVTPTIQ